MQRLVSRTLGVIALLACLPLSACRACKNDHPFVPYRIEGGVPAPSTSASPDASLASASTSVEAGAFVREPAVIAPPHATKWALGALALTAPEGGIFRQGLAWDIDGDGHEDALVLVEEGGNVPHDELVFYRGTADGLAPPAIVSLGAPLPFDVTDVQCARIEHLTRVGKHSAAVEVGEVCPITVAERGPDRVVALVAWSDSMKTRLVLPVVDPPAGQTLTLDLDGTDVDGDGLDDATLRVSLEGGEPPFEPGPAVHALFRWFDRPAGMSREPGEPEKSLHAIAALAAQRATSSKEAASGLALAAAGRFLFQAACEESPVRRVAPAPASSPLTCEAGHALEELGFAATRAYVTQGDALRAIAALDAAEAVPASHTPARVAEAAAWVTSIAPVVQATQIRAISAVPRLGPDAASWGALRFEPSGALLVRTPAGVVRVDPVHGDEVDAAGVGPWPTSVISPDGKLRLEGAFAPCRGASLEASVVASDGATIDGGDASEIQVPIAAPLAQRCASPSPGEHAREPVSVIPIAWGAGGLELLVAGQPMLIPSGSRKASPLLQLLGQPVTPGAPRSPDGATLVVATSQGIVVHGQKTRILRAKELEHGYGELRDCTVSDDAARVACVRGGVAFVGVWPAP